MEQIFQKSIRFKEEDGDKHQHQIEGLHKDNVKVIVYKDNGGIMTYYPKYEELPSDTIDLLFRMMLSQYI
jgi:hypothetical protein